MRARVWKLHMQVLRLAASSRSATQEQDRFAYLWKPFIHVRASWLVEQLARVRVLEVVCDVVVDHDDNVVIRNAAPVQHLVCLPQSDMRVLLDRLIFLSSVMWNLLELKGSACCPTHHRKARTLSEGP